MSQLEKPAHQGPASLTFPGRAVQPTSMVGMIDRPAVFFFGGGLPINVIVTAHLVKITWELEEEGLLQRHSRD